jgi:multidrug resistance efflux pump
MKKRYWKSRAAEAEAKARTAEERAFALRSEIQELQREVEDKRKNWAPIKITHPWVPRDPACKFCDDPREDPRHAD